METYAYRSGVTVECVKMSIRSQICIDVTVFLADLHYHTPVDMNTNIHVDL